MDGIQDYIRARAGMVDAALHQWFAGTHGYHQVLYDAMMYSLFAGGKRLRPVLCLATAEALGVTMEYVLPAACAVEMIHTYSLIHDDLPALDDDDYRRGNLTNHKVYGESTAILAGDALLTSAFEMIMTCPLPANQVVAMSRELAQAAGAEGMVGGQIVDMIYEQKPADKSALTFIHERKTGALLTAPIRMAGLAVPVEASVLHWLTQYGRCIGLGFQIMDDILDVVGDAAVLGKATGADAALHKATYPALYGVERSREMVEALTKEAIDCLHHLSPDTDIVRLEQLAIWMGRRDR